jgi:hypothetical protein
METRRGFLLGEETIKIILAVICIAGLIIFIIYIYNGYAGNQDSRNAEATLNHLLSDIKGGVTQEQIYNPQNWVLISFPSQSTDQKNFPPVCTSNKWKTCLCICSDVNSCSNKGSCVQSDFSVQGGFIQFEKLPMPLSISPQSKTISKSQ